MVCHEWRWRCSVTVRTWHECEEMVDFSQLFMRELVLYKINSENCVKSALTVSYVISWFVSPVIIFITLIKYSHWSCPYKFKGRKHSCNSTTPGKNSVLFIIIQGVQLVNVCVCEHQKLWSGPGGLGGVGYTKSLYLHLLCGLHNLTHLLTNTQSRCTVWFKSLSLNHLTLYALATEICHTGGLHGICFPAPGAKAWGRGRGLGPR